MAHAAKGQLGKELWMPNLQVIRKDKGKDGHGQVTGKDGQGCITGKGKKGQGWSRTIMGWDDRIWMLTRLGESQAWTPG